MHSTRLKGSFTYTDTKITFTPTHSKAAGGYEWVEIDSLPFIDIYNNYWSLPEHFINSTPANYKFDRDNNGNVTGLFINNIRYYKSSSEPDML